MKNLFFIASFFLLADQTRAIDFTEQGEYLGSSDCIVCHERFYELWSTSHHGKAMEAFAVGTAAYLQVYSQIAGAIFLNQLATEVGPVTL